MIPSFWWLEINYEANLNADTRCWTQSMISFCVLFLSFRCLPERRGPTRLILKGHGSVLFNKWLADGFDITQSMTVSPSHFKTHLSIYFSSSQGTRLSCCLVMVMSPFLMFLDFRRGNGFFCLSWWSLLYLWEWECLWEKIYWSSQVTMS